MRLRHSVISARLSNVILRPGRAILDYCRGNAERDVRYQGLDA